jgi:hypothetical protein
VDLNVALSNDAWGWDSMASVCCSGCRAHFVTLRRCAPVNVKTADKSIVTATHCGTVVIRIVLDSGDVIRLTVDNVLYHERFASNLLSGERMTKQLGWEYHSTKEHTYVVTPGGHRVTLSSRGRISVLLGAGPERAYAALIPGAGRGAHVKSDAVDALVRLHARLNHMGFDRMLGLIRSGRVEGLGQHQLAKQDVDAARIQLRECRGCIFGKLSRTAFGHRGLDRGDADGGVLHMDTYQVKCNDEHGKPTVQYGLTMIDIFSREAWFARLMSKDLVAAAVIKIIRQSERQSGRVVKRLVTDGGSEFINVTIKAECAKQGMKLHFSPTASQELDGGAERSVRTFKDFGRSMLHHARAPEYMWKLAMDHAIYIWNRTQISQHTKKTPYEAARGRKPSLDSRHFGVWGCDCFVHQRKDQRDGAMAAKAEPAIYLGHDDAQNSARVLILRNKKIVVSRDVKFLPERFEHMRAYRLGDSEVGALLDGRLLEDANLQPILVDESEDRQPAQGGMEQPVADPAKDEDGSNDNDPAADPKEWKVDHIVASRKRLGHVEYRVRWSGFDSEDDTWEPENNLKDCEALDIFLAGQQQPAAANADVPVEEAALPAPAQPVAVAPRRSPRFSPPVVGEDQHARVEMAMSALRDLQTIDERPEDEEMVWSAIAAGTAALEERTPKTLQEALSGPDAAQWKAARQKEWDSCVAKDVWELVPRASLPEGTNILPCKDVFKIKVDEHGKISQFKARFTPKGFRQKYGVDFFETFARTGMYKTLRLALSIAALLDYELEQFDVPTAFLNADVEEDIYMEVPAGFAGQELVCKLKKSLYGLKQAPRNWDKLMHGFITGKMGWKATVSDPSLYFKRSRTGRVMLIFRFVDDMQGMYHKEDRAEFKESADMLQKRFEIKALSSASWMLGMRITRDRKARTIKLDQELYVMTAVERYHVPTAGKFISTPELVGAASDTNPALDEPADRQRYMEITGTLMYAAISTRPDIAHAVHYLASNMQAPQRRHMQAAERVLRYLFGTRDVGLVFGAHNGDAVGDSRGRGTQMQAEVCAFADADWANNKGDRKSVSGWVAKLNGDLISWSSKKQRVVALSTCEAELYAEAAAIQEVLWLRGILTELGLHVQTCSPVYGDNQSTIAVSQNGVKSERTKHVDVKYHFITETVESGKVKLQWVPSNQQQADIFTKPLGAQVFLLLRKQLMSK